MHRVWPDRDGNISYLLTMCVAGRASILDNEPTFERLVEFLLDSPTRYFWFGVCAISRALRMPLSSVHKIMNVAA